MRVRDIRFRYNDEPVLSGVSLDIDPGELLVIMGANGSGKTTLLRLLAGLREPLAGTIEAGDTVGFSPEDPRAALFSRTVAEEVAFFPRNRGLDADRATERAMVQLAVDHLADRNPLTLSFGEQRRVAIAAVLAGDPAVVALDEPTAGLDRAGQTRLGTLLDGLEAAVVVSTHASEFAYQYADRVAVLADGRVERVGPARTVLSEADRLEAAGIRPPGAVTWARQQGLDEPPDSVKAAATAVRERL